ncbi:spermidine synthase [Halorientalis marina]|uniref:spermidine synthase n=1 Tax=Halorientalis marina TaxID=2931976 RepID=UPI001FF43B79|nr:spermidine synthase [Halorientalis marina]
MPRPLDRRSAVFALTFVVAFCSIVYELVYSELLAVLFGGTVVRYSVTIGLFLFSLGVGAFCFRYLDDHPSNFFRLEVYLAVLGPLGLVFIVGVNAVPITGGPETEAALERLALYVSHLPIVVVGFLSGLEIPFLTDLADAERGESGRAVGVVAAVGRGSRRVARAVVGLPFRASDDDGNEGDESSFSAVLGMDYLGSLVGTVTYALVLYPSLGLIPTVFVLGLLNAVAALAFYLLYREGGATEATADGAATDNAGAPVDVTFGTTSHALLAICLLAVGAYAGALVYEEDVSTDLRNLYLEEQFEGEYPNRQMEVRITGHASTRYQDVVFYEREWTGGSAIYQGRQSPQTCLRLDTAVQLCESWVDSYHSGLVDVSVTMAGDLSDRRVLLVGGGDWIAADRLRERNATVDMVDLDREFMNYTKDHPYFERYHDDAYRYENLTVHATDAYTYLRDTDREYDLILLDLPGARSDDLLHLYSTEFYRQLRAHLADGGLVATWSYSRYDYPQHRKAYLTTVREAGFESYLRYHAYDDLNGDGDAVATEQFYVLSPGPTPEPDLQGVSDPYLRRHADRYRSATWRPIPTYRGVRPNSIFHPNYDIIVDR